MRSKLQIILVTILLPTAAISQDCIQYDDYLHWARGIPFAHEARDMVTYRVGFTEYLYATTPQGLRVADLANQGFPDYIDFLPLIDAQGLEIDGNYLYVAVGDAGLLVYDLTNPAEISLAGQLDLDGYARAVDVQFPIAYVVGNAPDLQLVNIINPANLIALGSLDFASGSARDVLVDGFHAYIADSAVGMQVVHVAGAFDLDIVGSFSSGAAWALGMYAGYIYLLETGDFWVVDIADPTSPFDIAHVDGVGDLRDVAFAGFRAFMASASRGVLSFDITNPADPQLTGDLALIGAATSLAKPFGSTYLYAGGFEDAHVIDRSNPDSPASVGWMPTDDGCLDVVAAGGMAYVADGYAGLKIIDLSTPSAPTLAGSLSGLGNATGVDRAGSHACVASGDAGLHLIEVFDPTTPVLAGTYDPAGFTATRLEMVGDLAFVADEDYGLRVVDVGDPDNLGQVGEEEIPGGITCIDVVGDYAYAATLAVGLRVIDVSTPTAPQLVGSLPFVGYIQNVSASDNEHVFLACEEQGIQVVDVTDPADPVIIVAAATPYLTWDVFAAGPYVYAADLLSVRVFDMVSPAFPDLVGSIATDWAWSLFADESLVYIGNGDSPYGLLLAPAQCGAVAVDVETPPAPGATLAVHPNPFNPRTTITFALERAGSTEIGIYDLTGRRVRLLADRIFAAGDHSLAWNGRDDAGRALPSAPYLVRLDKATGTESRKVMLVR